MKNELVSILMSTKDTDLDVLKLSIDSILSQTYKNFEFIIICDGGESDYKFVESYNDKRIKIIKHEVSVGLTKSLNEALKIARGNYIARMDSDDISLMKRLELQVDYMDKNPDIAMCSMFYRRFGNEDDFIFNMWSNPDDIQSQLFYTNVIAHPVVMFRKSFLEQHNVFYDETYIYSQDFELWNRISKLGKIAIIPKIGLYYRMHGGQISTSKKELQSSLYEKVLIRNLEELELDSKDLEYVKMLNGRLNSINFYELSDFIDEVISQNKIKKIYNEKSLMKVLNNQYLLLALKNKFFDFRIMMKRKVYSISNFLYMIKKIYFVLQTKVYKKLND